MYEAFGWQPPEYVHVGLLQDSNKAKLSKRNSDTNMSYFRERDVFPEALINYVALLGWSHDRKRDFMTFEELIDSVRAPRPRKS